jgi:hypothetical protein
LKKNQQKKSKYDIFLLAFVTYWIIIVNIWSKKMNENEKELLDNFRALSPANQSNLLTYAAITKSTEITTKQQYGLPLKDKRAEQPVRM